jgi:hypothetical protein
MRAADSHHAAALMLPKYVRRSHLRRQQLAFNSDVLRQILLCAQGVVRHPSHHIKRLPSTDHRRLG